MDAQFEFKKILRGEMDRAKGRNPSFSLRAFAKRLGLQPSALSEIMNGKRMVSKKMANKVLERLCVPPNERAALLSGLDRNGKMSDPETAELIQVNMDHYYMIADWYHFAILSLSETPHFRGEPQWIADHLNITAGEAKQALIRLERLGLLERNKKNQLTWSGVHFTTTTDIANLSLRKSHYQNLELAKDSLDKDDVEERDFSSMTMAIDPKKIPEAKKRIREFRRSLSAFLENGEKTQVYRICLQLFPLSRSTK